MEYKCPECGAELRIGLVDEHWVCPNCDREYWECDGELTCPEDDPEYDVIYDNSRPAACSGCGGDYPNCIDSCERFDD